MTMTRTELDVTAVPDLRIAAYSPADDETRALLPLTRPPKSPESRRRALRPARCPARSAIRLE